MTEQDALEAFFAEWDRQANEYGASLTREQRDCAEEAWNAALTWLRSQGEPVGYTTQLAIKFGHFTTSPQNLWGDKGVPLYAAPQPAIPDGFVLVPKEPTPEMLNAAGPRPAKWNATPAGRMLREEGDKIRCEEWAQMIAAAPEPSK